MNKEDIIYEVDCDGVIRKTMDSVYTYLKTFYPDKVPNEKPIHKQWDISVDYPKMVEYCKGRDINFFDMLFNKSAYYVFLTFAKPEDGATDFIKELNKKNGKVFLSTHQSINGMFATLKWIDKYNFNFDGFNMTGSNIDKNNLKNSILIDDKPKNIKAHGKYSILMDRPWNRDFEYDYRAFDFDDALNCINNLEKELINKQGE